VPALRASRSDLVADLKDRTGQPAPAGWWNPRSVLVVAQVALALIALIGAGLFVRSLGMAQRVDPGFQVDHLVVLQVNLTGQGYSEARGREFQRQMLERAASLPGVSSAGLAVTAPFIGGFTRTIVIEGEESTATGKGRLTLALPVTPRFLGTMGIRILRGRDFNDLDQPNTPRVAVINDVM